MKALGILVLILSSTANAHDSYVSGNRLHNAIRAVYAASANSGFRGDCFSCHSNVPQIPASGFGRDVFNRTAALFGNGNTQLTQAQMQTLVNDNMLKTTDSDGDTYNNQAEFQAGSDPGDRNSTPVTPTTTTTTLRPPSTPTPNPDKVTKQTGKADPNGNYLNSGGCSLSRREAQNILNNKETEQANALGLVGIFLAPLVIGFGLRKKK